MNKFGLILTLACFQLLACLQLHANFIYRSAVQKDSHEIWKLHDQFTKTDKENLLLFPEHIQKSIIKKNIEKGRLFVSCEEKTGQITSFLKLHLVEHSEIDNMLEDELNISTKASIIKESCYSFSHEKKIDFKKPITSVDITRQDVKDLITSADLSLIRNIPVKYDTDFCLHLYLGSAYTSPKYRGQGLYANLLIYTINKILNPIKKNVINCKFLSLLYGQVNANSDSLVMVRVFANWIAQELSDKKDPTVFIKHFYSRAYKPEVDMDGNINITKDKEHEGYGNMVLYKFKN